jgi:tetratricopeptide (TPR) repeat protein
MDWSVWLKEQDSLIKNANSQLVFKNIQNLNWSQVPSNIRIDVLDIARRLQMSFYITKHLYREVRVMHNDISKVSAKEVALYAVSLAKIGAFNEAWNLFKAIQNRKEVNPIIHLYMGMALMTQWNYVDAVGYLEQYVSALPDGDYQKLIGKVNLAACLIVKGDLERTKELLLEFDDLEKSYPLLFLNTRELLLQVYFNEKKYDLAIETCRIIRANPIFSSTGLYYSLISKWEIIIDSFSKGVKSDKWDDFETEMRRINQFEVVRDLDYYSARISDDSGKYAKLYLGTPYRAYKEKIMNYWNPHSEGYSYFEIKGPAKKGKILRVVDLSDQMIYRGEEEIQAIPPKLALAMRALTKDLYRPVYIGDLFDTIYDGEYFNPHSSPKRLEKLFQKVHSFFKQFNITFLIRSSRKTFWLEIKSYTHILVSNKKVRIILSPLEQLINSQKLREFSRHQIQKLLKTSKSNTQRMISELAEQNKISIHGKGKLIVYKVKLG